MTDDRLPPVDLSGSVQDVIGRLVGRLNAAGLLAEGEGLKLYVGAAHDGIAALPWPTEGRWERDDLGLAAWIACFAVRGGSEGFYVHVEAIFRPAGRDMAGRRVLLALGKEWSADRALEVANACARLLEAV